MPWEDKGKWLDDDGSEKVGTPFTADRMNNLEALGTDLAAANINLTATKAIALQASAVALSASGGAVAASAAAIAASAAAVWASAAALNATKIALSASAGAVAASAGAIGASGAAIAASAAVVHTNQVLGASGMGYIFHGSSATTPRGSDFKDYTWVGTVEPVNASAYDPWINPEDFGINSELIVPTTRVFKSGVQEIAAATVTMLTFDGERWDVGGCHSTTTNTGRLTAPKTGVYNVTGYAAWPAEISNPWFLAIRKNGTGIFGAQWHPAAFQSEGHVSAEVFLEAGEYVELVIFQNQGKAIKTAAKGTSNYEYGAELSMTWLGSGSAPGTPQDWGLVTALPAGAGVGDTCKLKVRESESSPWKVWNCVKVEAEGARPWAADGPPLFFNNTGSPATTATTYQTKEAPIGEAPFAGEYDIEYGVADFSAGASLGGRIALFLAGVEFSSVLVSITTSGALPGFFPVRAALAKAAAIAERYKLESAGSGTFFGMYVKVYPVRVG
jgi:hypothetical protein